MQRRNISISFVPEDRLGHSAIPQLSLIDNVLLSQYGGNNYTKLGIINNDSIDEENIKKILDEKIKQILENHLDQQVHIAGMKIAREIMGSDLMTREIIRETKPDKLIICWDGEGGSAKRKILKKDYKYF